MEAVKSQRPTTVGQLAHYVVPAGVEEADFVDTVKKMTALRLLRLSTPSYEIESFFDYLSTITLSGQFWLTLAVALFGIAIITLSPALFPFDLIRWMTGFAFVLFLPGYSAYQLIFLESRRLGFAERLALDVGLSLALAPLVGVILGLTPIGITLASTTACLAGLTIILTFGSAARKYRALNK